MSIMNPEAWSKQYSLTVPYGSASKLDHSLSLYTAESIINDMSGGWDTQYANYYNSEWQIGAYAGYIFDRPLQVNNITFYIGRYSGQNTTLFVTPQYYDGETWVDMDTDLSVTPSISYPINSYTVPYGVLCYGVRWAHIHEPRKSTANNILFFGMLVDAEDPTPPGPTPGNMEIVIQYNASENIRVDKSITDVQTLTGSLREESSIINPVFLVAADIATLAGANYLSIPVWRRKYFITEMVSVRTGLVRISAHVDVLSSWPEELRACIAIVHRQENDWNLYLNDGTFRTYQNPDVFTQPFPSGFNALAFVLAVAGGSGSSQAAEPEEVEPDGV